MDSDALIGQLYREVQEVRQSNEALIALVGSIKSGKIALDQVEVKDGKVMVHRPKEAPVKE